MGLPILGRWIISSGLYNITDGSKVQIDSKRWKTAIESRRNKGKESYKASRVFNLPQNNHSVMLNPAEKFNGSNKNKNCRRQVLPCEAEYVLNQQCRLMERKIFGVRMTHVMHLAYPLAVRIGIKSLFWKRNEENGRNGNFLRRHQEILVTNPEYLHSQE